MAGGTTTAEAQAPSDQHDGEAENRSIVSAFRLDNDNGGIAHRDQHVASGKRPEAANRRDRVATAGTTTVQATTTTTS